MNLKLQKQPTVTVVEKGDVLVFKHTAPTDREFTNYLVIEDNPNDNFTLLNLNSCNLMSVTRAKTANDLLYVTKQKFPHMKLVEIIKADKITIERA